MKLNAIIFYFAAQLPNNFYDLMLEKKWQLRKEAMEALLPLCRTPKMVPNGDYNELLRVVQAAVSKDNNVMVAALGCQCLAGN